MKHRNIKYTTTVHVEGMQSEVLGYLSYELIPEKAGIYTINSKVVYRELEYTIPPVAITVQDSI